jgi:hypothetical protein
MLVPVKSRFQSHSKDKKLEKLNSCFNDSANSAAFYKTDSLHQFQEFRNAQPSNSINGTSHEHLGCTNMRLIAYWLAFIAGSNFNLTS